MIYFFQLCSLPEGGAESFEHDFRREASHWPQVHRCYRPGRHETLALQGEPNEKDVLLFCEKLLFAEIAFESMERLYILLHFFMKTQIRILLISSKKLANLKFSPCISVPDPILLVTDPDQDPQIENQEFLIRIPIRIRILL